MNLSAVREAIMSRHSEDLVVPECKDGPTHGASHSRLDYWVLRRSWAHPAMIGYEVKASRADWLSDRKWQSYLPLCNELWFIADRDSILAGELPEGVGHLRLAGSRLITVRRAAWREIPAPENLLTYVLMCRTRIEREHQTGDGQAAYWREWLARRGENRRIGYEVSKTLRERFEHDVDEVRSENGRLRSEVEKLSEFRAALEAHGIDWKPWTTGAQLVDEILAPRWKIEDVRRAHDALASLLDGPARTKEE